MRKYCWRKVVLPMALFCIFVFHTEVLAEVDKLSINQMIQNGNNVFLYVSVLDDEGRPVTETLPAERFSVLIDKDEMLIPDEAARFQSLEEGMNYVFCIDISKSVTEQEMQEIRAGISAFVNGVVRQIKRCSERHIKYCCLRSIAGESGRLFLVDSARFLLPKHHHAKYMVVQS